MPSIGCHREIVLQDVFGNATLIHHHLPSSFLPAKGMVVSSH
ncbi:Uncharacterised protein [Vibrio cholerae]|nr:Uncharacterised protein [Vibrio cholerae]